MALQDISPSWDDRFQAILHNYKNRDASLIDRLLPIALLKSRNTLLFNRKDIPWLSILRFANEDVSYWINNLDNDSQLTRSSATLGQASAAAWILRDSDGFFLTSGQSTGRTCNSVLEAELQALLMAMQYAWSRRYSRIIFEGDNKNLHDLVTRTALNFEVHNWICDIRAWQSRFQSAQFMWTSRNNNKAADSLVKHMAPLCSFESQFFVPSCINQALFEDHVAYFQA